MSKRKRSADRMRAAFIYNGEHCEYPWAVARPLGDGRFTAKFDVWGAVTVYAVEFDSWRWGFHTAIPFPKSLYLMAGDSLVVTRKFTITAATITG